MILCRNYKERKCISYCYFEKGWDFLQFLTNVLPIFQLVAPNGDFDSDLQSVNVVGTGESAFLDTYLKDDILESVVIDVTDNTGSGASRISAVEAVFEYCDYQGEDGIKFLNLGRLLK